MGLFVQAFFNSFLIRNLILIHNLIFTITYKTPIVKGFQHFRNTHRRCFCKYRLQEQQKSFVLVHFTAWASLENYVNKRASAHPVIHILGPWLYNFTISIGHQLQRGHDSEAAAVGHRGSGEVWQHDPSILPVTTTSPRSHPVIADIL